MASDDSQQEGEAESADAPYGELQEESDGGEADEASRRPTSQHARKRALRQ